MILPVIERYKRMKFFSSVVLGIGLLLSLNAVQLYGLPAIEEARILNPGEQRYRLQADLASNYSIGQSGAESIVLDGEITRLCRSPMCRTAGVCWMGLSVVGTIPSACRRAGGLPCPMMC